MFLQKGWRRTGIINVVLAYTCGLALLICLITSISQPGSSLGVATIIFEGKCAKSTRLNLVLHLVLNILSSGILVSSNFFMQVLSSPSRHEIDQAHMWLRSVEIGVSSIKNLRHVSRLKLIGWLLLLISSIPIHLLFNSAIFETTFNGENWHLTIATEAFTKGAAFFPPGASLSPAGAPNPICAYNQTSQKYSHPVLGTVNNYGEAILLGRYWDDSSGASQNISSTASEAHSWTSLTPEECQNEYKSCSPKQKYGDVVAVVQSRTDNATGWRRSDVFHFDPASNLSSLWDSYIPSDSINSLWYSTQCKTTRTQGSVRKRNTCTNTCVGALGGGDYMFIETDAPPVQTPWSFSFNPFSMNSTRQGRAFGYNDGINTLEVRYCLARTIPEQCKVGLSNSLLFIVILCVFIKAAVCNLVVWKLPAASLVNPGDAMQSFITNPDPVTKGLGTLDINDSQQLEVSLHSAIHLSLRFKSNVNLVAEDHKALFSLSHGSRHPPPSNSLSRRALILGA